jgi:hypothetical protein
VSSSRNEKHNDKMGHPIRYQNIGIICWLILTTENVISQSSHSHTGLSCLSISGTPMISSPCCNSTVKLEGESMLEVFPPLENVHTIWNGVSVRDSPRPKLSRVYWVALNVIMSGGVKLKSDEEHSVMASIPFTSSLDIKSHTLNKSNPAILWTPD